jgi:hypothetical protein
LGSRGLRTADAAPYDLSSHHFEYQNFTHALTIANALSVGFTELVSATLYDGAVDDAIESEG